MKTNASIEVFSTCPPSSRIPQDQYLDRLVQVAQWSEAAGCTGILVFSDNSVLDPWALSHLIVQHTKSLSPLVAIQPVYMHPYWVAKQITTFGYLYGRRLYLNMVAGGFKNDLDALNDLTPHDKRYARLVEYTTIVTRLLTDSGPVTCEGEFHCVSKLKLQPPLSPSLVPDVFVSGSSEAGIDAARALGALAIKYPKAAGDETSPPADLRLGIRVGIITRPREADAWDVAHARFPGDRKGQLTRQLAEKVSDSVWHKQMAGLKPSPDSIYWMAPFLNYQAMCPYLVGSYEQVAGEMARFFGVGYRTVILDTPPDLEDLEHTFAAFEDAALQLWHPDLAEVREVPRPHDVLDERVQIHAAPAGRLI